MADLLEKFYEITLHISVSRYVTSNAFFNGISDMCCLLNEWKSNDDYELRSLGDKMKTKFDKYWGGSK